VIDELAALLRSSPLPVVDGGKESRGDLVIVGGSSSCPGAAILAGRAALRCGAGRVQLVVHPTVAAAVGAAFPEALVLGWDHGGRPPTEVRERLASAAAAVVGPGLGDIAAATAVVVSHVLDGGVLVVDAAAVPALTDPGLQRGALLAAPNPMEAARVLGTTGDADDAAQVPALAAGVAALVGGPAAVRGEITVLDDGAGRQWCSRSTPPGLGTPGSGDVLMGALGAFLARGAAPLTALAWAVAAHGEAGSILAEVHPIGFLASEVADALPAALQRLEAH
jgi:ADP-dependent NAD(P)H-hydrate dehydratase